MCMTYVFICVCVLYGYGDHRDLTVLTHSSPTLRSSDLQGGAGRGADASGAAGCRRIHLDRVRCRRLAGGQALPAGPPGTTGSEQAVAGERSEEHTSELQSLMRISYAVFCLKKKKKNDHITPRTQHTHAVARN